MSDNIGVTDWFTKSRADVSYPVQSDRMLDELISKIITKFDDSSRIKDLADGLYELLEQNELMKNISSDSRFPVCSLFHHLKNTSGIAVCLLLQRIEKDPVYVKKVLDNYGITAQYDAKDLVALVRVAALLHDIGKPRSFTSDSRYTKYHYHTRQTKEVIETILYDTTSILVSKFELEKILPQLASRHHGRDTTNELERLLSKADTVASAADRVNEVKGKFDIERDTIEITNRDRIFPHEINFDAADLKCLETPHTCVLGNGTVQKKKVQLKEGNDKTAQLFIDRTVGGGPIQYLGHMTPLTGKIGILSLDMSGIQGFIGEADKLKMLRGGSSIVDECLDIAAEAISKHVCKEAVLFKGGGNLLSFVPDIEVVKEKLQNEIKTGIKEASKNGLEAAVISFSTDLATVAGEFHELLDRSQSLLDQDKNRTYQISIIPERKDICEYCSTRPLPASSDMCKVCTVKKQRGEAEKFSMSRKFIKNTYGANYPTELIHLGSSIGALVVDGNMMGMLFQQTTTPAEYTFKSQSFEQRFNRVLQETIASFVDDRELRKLLLNKVDGIEYIGLDVLYSGGDDVLILMNAKGVLQFAETLISNISKEFMFKKTFQNGTIFSNPVVTVSCGIAIADSRFPVYFLLDAARKMESKSKDAFRDRTKTDDLDLIKKPEGAIAFIGISSAMPTDSHSCFVLDGSEEVSGPFVQLKKMISIALTRKDSRALISDIITCGDSEHERLDLIKYMYSSLHRKSDIGLDECEWMAGVLTDDNVLSASKMIIPHLLHGIEEDLI